ncbi:MAG: NAD(+)/NADH kinase [Oscillospiraceae bacterium]|jgi:NAD+ kinase|nr:NAD(+)/NADH kinase [Oscillospiraceae bacterium]
MIIALLPNLEKTNAPRCTREIISRLHSLGAKVYMRASDRQQAYDADRWIADFKALLFYCNAAIAVGGDGTIIHEARHTAIAGKPILGINTGRIGFVAGLEPNELSLLKNLVSGNYTIENRLMLRAQFETEGCNRCIEALNDVVIARGTRSKIIDFEVGFNNSEMAHYRADGLIFATPTGSTAYSLSAGGPVLDPAVSGFLLTPVCSLSLASRPVVFGQDACLTVKAFSDENDKNYLTVDGDDAIALNAGQTITVSRSPYTAQLIKLKKNHFYEVVNKKLIERRT